MNRLKSAIAKNDSAPRKQMSHVSNVEYLPRWLTHLA